MIKILINIVDDEPIWVKLASEQLSSPDFDVKGFGNSQDFFSEFSSDVDLVIMDNRLKDGTEIKERIERLYAISPNCYLIIVSAFFDVPLMQQLIRLRVNDTVVKSTTWLEDLQSAVDGLKTKLLSRASMKGALI